MMNIEFSFGINVINYPPKIFSLSALPGSRLGVIVSLRLGY